MHLGIFAKTFPRPSLEETLDAVGNHRLTHVQFNMSCAGLPTLPERIGEDLCGRIADAVRARGLTIAAVSGTYNMLRPVELPAGRGSVADVDREPPPPVDYEQRLEVLASACRWLGTRLITLCTGTLDEANMWRWHPRNVSREAWDRLVKAMRRVVKIADRHEVMLGVEPEVSNVINTACKARRLLDEVGSPWLKIVIDPANLFRSGELPRMNEILEEAFELLGPDIVLAHAKDLNRDGEAGDVPPGRGVLDYDLYLRLLSAHGYTGPLIIHGLAEPAVRESVGFLRHKLGRLESGPN
jgi:sugar phosphate isomerase/epimerase